MGLLLAEKFVIFCALLVGVEGTSIMVFLWDAFDIVIAV